MPAYRDDDARAPRPIHYTTEWFVYKQTRTQTNTHTRTRLRTVRRTLAHKRKSPSNIGHNKRAFYDSQAYIRWHKIPFNSKSRKNNDKAFCVRFLVLPDHFLHHFRFLARSLSFAHFLFLSHFLSCQSITKLLIK